MNPATANAMISAAAAVITAVVALILNYRGFASIDSRFASLENHIGGLSQEIRDLRAETNRRFEAIESDLKEFFKVQAEHDKRLARIEDKLGIPPR
jgi:hypothetical protein